MAGMIKGITIEFGANTEKLNKALGNVQGKLNKTQAELKQVNRALKFNPGNTTLLKQKFDLLSKTVSDTQRKLTGLQQMQKRMDKSGVDRTSAAYRKLELEIVKTQGKLKVAEGELRRFGSIGRQQAMATGKAFQAAGAKIKTAGRGITTSFSVYGMMGIYAGKKLIDMSEKQAQAEEKLQEIYKSRMGVGKKAVKSTLELASAQQKAGVVGNEVQIAGAQQLATYAKYPGSVNKMLPALNNLLVQQKGLNGTQEDATSLANMFGKAMMGQTGALKKAGISFTDAQAEVLKYGTEEEKAAMIAEVVNQNVGNMNEKFAQTDAGKIQQAKNALGDMGEQIGAILLPAVADLVSWFQEHVMPVLQKFIDFMQAHPQIATFALAIAAITAVLGPIIMMIGGFISALGTIISIAPMVGSAISVMLGPVGLIIAAIAAAVAIGVALYKNWDTIKAKASAIWNSIKATVTKVVTQLVTSVRAKFTAFKNTVTNIWNGIKTSITDKIQAAKDKVKAIIDKIKNFFPIKLKKIVSFMLPKINIGSKSTKVGDKNVKSPTFGVGGWHHYAKAATNPYIFSRPTGIVVGDAGQDEILYGRRSLMEDIASVVGGVGGDMIVNVYGSDNMSVNDLANAVEQKLINMQKRRTQAWA